MKGSAARSTAEETLTLNVNRLHRDGCLEPGSSGSRSGSAEDNLFAPISRGMSDSLLTLSYGLPGASAKDLEEIVPIIRVPCRYGGSRPYFVCPGIRERRLLRPARGLPVPRGPLLCLPALQRHGR